MLAGNSFGFFSNRKSGKAAGVVPRREIAVSSRLPPDLFVPIYLIVSVLKEVVYCTCRPLPPKSDNFSFKDKV